MLSQCPICGDNAALMSWHGIECSHCGSVSATHVPSEEDLNAYYHDFNQDYDGGGGHLERYAKRYLTIVSRIQASGRLVDVGPSLSPFPNLAVQAGYQVTAIDYVRPRALSENVEFVEGNLNSIDVLNKVQNTYDIVCNFAVIEHCMLPACACGILSSLCRLGGHIVLTTPEIGTFAASNALGHSGWFHPPSHLYLLSRTGLARLFLDYGCQLVESSRFELNMFRWLARYGIGAVEGSCGWIVKTLCRRRWDVYRETRQQWFKGIACYVFEKCVDSGKPIST